LLLLLLRLRLRLLLLLLELLLLLQELLLLLLLLPNLLHALLPNLLQLGNRLAAHELEQVGLVGGNLLSLCAQLLAKPADLKYLAFHDKANDFYAKGLHFR